MSRKKDNAADEWAAFRYGVAAIAKYRERGGRHRADGWPLFWDVELKEWLPAYTSARITGGSWQGSPDKVIQAMCDPDDTWGDKVWNLIERGV